MSGFHGCGYPCLDVAYEFLGVELYVVEYFGYGFSVDDAVYFVAVLVDADVDGVGVAEQVVHVAEYLLVRSYEEYSEVIWFAGTYGVYGQG